MRPPQQKPVTTALEALPPFLPAHARVASRSPITWASGTLATSGMIWATSVNFVGSPWRT